jgi:hypothetical protein
MSGPTSELPHNGSGRLHAPVRLAALLAHPSVSRVGPCRLSLDRAKFAAGAAGA